MTSPGIPLTLASNDPKALPGSTGSDFTITFPNPTNLGNLNWQVGLVGIYTAFSTPNVSATLGNNRFAYSIDSGSSWKFITFDTGNYTVDDLNLNIQREMRDNGDWDSVNKSFYISLEPNYATNKVKLFIDNASYQVDFSIANNLASFLGFDEAVVTSTSTGSTTADVTNGVSAWLVECDLTKKSYVNGEESSVIFSFIPNVATNDYLEITPNHVTYAQVSTERISSIRIRLTDQLGNVLDLNGENTTVFLEIKPFGTPQ